MSRIAEYLKSGFLLLALSYIPIVSNAEVHINNITHFVAESNAEELVKEVLKNTEASLVRVEDNVSESLMHVEKALSGLRGIKGILSPDTHADSKSPLVFEENNEYWFIYPQVSIETLNNKDLFPTLHAKFESGILYQGELNESNHDQKDAAYFDYAFAYASLITAREALNAKNHREAISSLKWVFEAVYVSPDFYVAQFDKELKLDKLHNFNKYQFIQFSDAHYK